jgi:hypothetical protein
MIVPNFIVAGAQKSGTTYLQHCLQDHPDVFMPEQEIPYFEDFAYHNSPWEEFTKLFNLGMGKKAIGMKRPDYMGRPNCAENIHERIPDVKLFFVLRNPVERAISAYCNFVGYACLPVEPINFGLRNVMSGAYKDYGVAKEIIDFGFYHRHLMRFNNIFPRENVMVIRFEDITQRPADIFRLVYRFLGVDENHVPSSIKNRYQVTARSLISLHFKSLMSELTCDYCEDRSRFDPKQMNEAEKHLVSFVNQLYEKLVRPHFQQVAPIDGNILDELYRIYEQDILALETETEWDLADWKRKV